MFLSWNHFVLYSSKKESAWQRFSESKTLVAKWNYGANIIVSYLPSDMDFQQITANSIFNDCSLGYTSDLPGNMSRFHFICRYLLFVSDFYFSFYFRSAIWLTMVIKSVAKWGLAARSPRNCSKAVDVVFFDTEAPLHLSFISPFLSVYLYRNCWWKPNW